MTIPWWNVDLGDEAAEAVAKAVRDRNISMGKIAAQFEDRVAELLGVPHVVAVGNGTSALVVALLEAGVGPGDEVIIPDVTWIATAHAAAILGAKPVLADVGADRPILEPENFAAAITPRTKAVVPVHLNGRACDMPALLETAARHGIAVIEDAAQALLSRNSDGAYLGTLGRAGCFSLSMGKLVTAGQGGFVVTRDALVAERLRRIRVHGVDSVMAPEWRMVGGNFRFTDLHAAIALTQLDKVEQRIAGVRRTYAFYADALRDSERFALYRPVDLNREIPLYVEARTGNPVDLENFLNARGIQARAMYPPLHGAPQFAPQAGLFVNANKFSSTSIWLPCGPDRGDGELFAITTAIREWLGGSGDEA